MQLTDVLSEVKTLRHEILKDKGNAPVRYLYATKFLLEEDNLYNELAKQLLGNIDTAIPMMLESSTFEEFVEKAGAKITDIKDDFKSKDLRDEGKLTYLSYSSLNFNKVKTDNVAIWGILIGKEIIMNKAAKKKFNFIHEEFRKTTTI